MLPIAKLTARLSFSTSVTFPYWMGNTFRGGFGIYLRRACCPDLKRDCYSCDAREDCIFYYTHMKKDSKVGYGAPPKPIVFIPPFFGKSFTVEKDGFLDMGILLFGRFTRYLPHVALGLSTLGQSGIGSERRYDVNKFKLEEMRCSSSNEVVYDGSTINIGAMKTVDIADYARDGAEFTDKLSIGFETPIMVKTGEFPPALDKLLRMIRQRLILYVNEYGDGVKIPDFECKATLKSSSDHFHNVKSRSQRAGKREFHTYTGTAEYSIESIDESAKQLLQTGLLIGAGPKPSFGFGFLKVIG
jgi:CRISPR-associated endoribonuclease Cas6